MNKMLEDNAKMMETLSSKMESVLGQIAENNDVINCRIDGLRDITPESGGAIREALQKMDSDVNLSLDQIKTKIGATTATQYDLMGTEKEYPQLPKTGYSKVVKTNQNSRTLPGEPRSNPVRDPPKKTIPYLKEKTEEDVAQIDWKTIAGQPRQNKSAVKLRLEREKHLVEKERAEKELIMCGIPSLRIDQPDHKKDMDSIMEVFAELSPARLGTGDGIRVLGSHLVDATRQLKHGDKAKLPFTILFKEKAIADKVRNACMKAGIWNRRKPKVPAKGAKKAADKTSPPTYLHAAHTSWERAKFRAQKEFDATPEGIQAKIFKSLEKSNKLDFTDYVDKEEEPPALIDEDENSPSACEHSDCDCDLDENGDFVTPGTSPNNT